MRKRVLPKYKRVYNSLVETVFKSEKWTSHAFLLFLSPPLMAIGWYCSIPGAMNQYLHSKIFNEWEFAVGKIRKVEIDRYRAAGWFAAAPAAAAAGEKAERFCPVVEYAYRDADGKEYVSRKAFFYDPVFYNYEACMKYVKTLVKHMKEGFDVYDNFTKKIQIVNEIKETGKSVESLDEKKDPNEILLVRYSPYNHGFSRLENGLQHELYNAKAAERFQQTMTLGFGSVALNSFLWLVAWKNSSPQVKGMFKKYVLPVQIALPLFVAASTTWAMRRYIYHQEDEI